jgi:NADPH:quinone reductase-like Zn-dependent oxidoreductase
MFRSGQYLEQPELPSRLGYEASGTVEEVGLGVTGLEPGDRVSSIPSFSMRTYWTYGEVALLPVHAVAKYPENLSPVEGASIWMQYMTAYGLIEFGEMQQGNYIDYGCGEQCGAGRDPAGECGWRHANCDDPEQREGKIVTGCRRQVRGQHED